MNTFFASFIFFVVILTAMSVGVLLGRKPIQGSCGGLGQIEGLGECELCGADTARCEEISQVEAEQQAVGQGLLPNNSKIPAKKANFYRA